MPMPPACSSPAAPRGRVPPEASMACLSPSRPPLPRELKHIREAYGEKKISKEEFRSKAQPGLN